MADQIVLVDTSILIDFYRKTDKAKSAWIALVRQGYQFSISAITKYEIYSGASQSQLAFWDGIFKAVTVIPFDESVVNAAVRINASLKRKKKTNSAGGPLHCSNCGISSDTVCDFEQKTF